MAHVSGYLRKAEEALACAEAEVNLKRYDNAANRLYSACFLAAIAGLIQADIKPGGSEWAHSFVQAELNGKLIRVRKTYPPVFRGLLNELEALRVKADYQSDPVSGKSLIAVMPRPREFVKAVEEVLDRA